MGNVLLHPAEVSEGLQMPKIEKICEALPSLSVSVKTLGRGSSVRAARARMYTVSRALATLGFRV